MSSESCWREAARLTIVILLGWVVCSLPSRWLSGEEGIFWMSVAGICCLVPGWIVVFLSRLAIFQGGISIILVQSVVRLTIVMAAAVLVKLFRPDLGIRGFYGWLILFYLLALAVEVRLLYRRITD